MKKTVKQYLEENKNAEINIYKYDDFEIVCINTDNRRFYDLLSNERIEDEVFINELLNSFVGCEYSNNTIQVL